MEKKKNKYIIRQKTWFVIAVISIALNMTIPDSGIVLVMISIFSIIFTFYNWIKGVSYEAKRRQNNFDDLIDEMKRNSERWQKRAEEQNQKSYSHSYKQQTTKKSISVGKLVIAFGLMKLKVDSTSDEIKKKYRKLVLKWHPDRWSTDTEENQVIAERNFKKLNNAYSLIKQHKNIK